MNPVFLVLSFLILDVSGLSSDGLALLSLITHWTSVPLSLTSSWNPSDSTPCSWLGIHCSNTTHHVTSLSLPGYQISGQLGPQIARLTHLKTLNLSNNSFSGAIPSHLSNCSLLQTLDLSQNFFVRDIPYSLQNLHNLRMLSLHTNLLSGAISDWLFQIPRLHTIFLDHNTFGGSIPSNAGNSSELLYLWLEYNELVGVIPNSIGNCSQLAELKLNNNALLGVLPESLNNLANILLLDVSNNSLAGHINYGSGNCKKLEYLYLSFSGFSGVLPPELGNCSSLKELAIVANQLTGTIPSSYGLLRKLSLLYLTENRLSGRIPSELGKCKSLIELKLYRNQLEGEIPSELGMLSELQNLELFRNNLTGEIPISIWKIPSLRHVLLYFNNLSGELPLELTLLKNLESITLFDNKFFGDIPQGLGVNSSLEIVDLMNNEFTGQIPPQLCFRKRLRVLNLGHNHFQGSIPSDVGNCPTIWRLILRHNNLSGVLPEFPANPSLSYMNITDNNVTGKIPSSLGNCTNLTSIDFSMNKLTGFIPPELGNLVNLTEMILAHNHLQGCFPPQLSTWKKLDIFDAGFNSFNCSIPLSLSNWTSLSTLILEENHFTGSIPAFLSKLKKLSLLRMGGNKMVGEIPSSIGELRNLRYGLSLRDNGLLGHIPLELIGLTNLISLDISSNNLTGSLEVLDEMQSLSEVNISHNLFTGPISKKLMEMLNKSPSSFLGNPGLCVNCSVSGDLNCTGISYFRKCDNKSNSGKALSRVEITMIALGSSLGLCLLLGLACLFLFCRKGRQEELGRLIQEDDEPRFCQIMAATENLNDRYIIGKGGHGTVFKAVLGPDNVFAVKKLEFAGHRDGSRSMVREIQTIEKIRHRNLVKVEDFWFKKNYGLIVYKYMENGSLHDVLYTTSPPQKLEWSVRYNIALGTAHGLAYLHYDCDPSVLHRDIKPQNILLDSEMEPHISDFGIAKLLDSSTSAASVSVSGTIGYIAPENAYTAGRGKESDVYSYGVVLLELITRKTPSDKLFTEEMDIVRWVRSIWSETQEITSIVDPSLLDETVESDISEQVTCMLFIAMKCTEKEPKYRPTMRAVVNQLLDLKS